MQSIELPLSPRSLTTKTVVVSTSKAHSEAWRLSWKMVCVHLTFIKAHWVAAIRDWILA